MPASHTTIQPLNPDVLLNHVLPSEANQIEISRNNILVILGATVWDILVYIPEDIRIIRRSKPHFVTFCFIFSRLSAVGFAIVNGIERVSPVNNVFATTISSGVLCMISMVASSYLFLRRLQAVYADTRWVRWFFFILWVTISAWDLVIPLTLNPKATSGTHYYRGAGIPAHDASSVFTLLLFDTSVLLAISYKIALGHKSLAVTERVPWYAFISGRALPRLSRAILRGGQQYYLITVGMSIVAGITVALPSVPQILKPMFPAAMISLMASMACRVFRDIKLFDMNNAFTEMYIHNNSGA